MRDTKDPAKWFVNAIMAWPAADAGRVQREVSAPFEQWTSRLTPEEGAKMIARQILAVQDAVGSRRGSRA